MQIPSGTLGFIPDAELGQGRRSLKTLPVSATTVERDEDDNVCVCFVSVAQSMASSECSQRSGKRGCGVSGQGTLGTAWDRHGNAL